MNICLVRPAVLHKEAAFSHMPTAPLGLAYIAAILRDMGHTIQVVDACIEGFHDVEKFVHGTYIFGLNIENTIALIRENTDMVCFTFMYTNNWMLDREIVKATKKKLPNATLIAGGEHVTAVPEYSFNTAPGLDYIVLGEGEDTIKQLVTSLLNKTSLEEVNRIAYLKDGKVVQNNFSRRIKRVEAIGEIPWPAWELFPLEKYFENKVTYGVYRGRSMPIMASRGCPYECTFCSNPVMWGKKYNLRDHVDVVDEIEFLHKKHDVTNFDFYDLTAIIQKDWIIKFCKELKDRNLNIFYQIPAGTRTEGIDLEVANSLFESGCKNITYAPESGSTTILKEIKKKVKLEHMYRSIKYSNQAGLNVKLNIMCGFPNETYLDVLSTIVFLVKSSWYGAHDMYPAVFSPYPGSKIYQDLVADGKIDIYDDAYLLEIISSHDLWPSKVYSYKVSEFFIKLATIVMYLSFYGSNFLFRPIRLYRMIRNLITNKHESRSELVIAQTFSEFKLSKSVKK